MDAGRKDNMKKRDGEGVSIKTNELIVDTASIVTVLYGNHMQRRLLACFSCVAPVK